MQQKIEELEAQIATLENTLGEIQLPRRRIRLSATDL